MTAISAEGPGRLELSRVLGDTFTIFRRSWPWLLAMGLPLSFAPLLLGYWLLDQSHWSSSVRGITLWSLLVSQTIMAAVSLIPGAIQAGLVCRRVATEFTGERPPAAIGWLPPLLLGALVAATGLLLGTLLLLVPAVLLWAMWAVFTPAVVLEHRGPISGLRRSVALTRGHRWKILAAGLIFFVAYLVLFYGIALALHLVWRGVGPEARPWVAWTIRYGTGSVSGMIYATLWRVAETVLFFQLVRLESGAPAQGVAEVFG